MFHIDKYNDSKHHSSGRDLTIDICRGLGIVLVIYGHALEVTFFGKGSLVDTQFSQSQFIYGFHMPLFFFISGNIFRERSMKEAMISSLQLLFVVLAVHLINAATQSIRHPVEWKKISTPLLTLTHVNIAVLWYLIAQAFVQIIFLIMHKYNMVWRGIIFMILIFLHHISQVTGQTWYQIQAWAPGVFFYWLGKKSKDLNMHRKIDLPPIFMGLGIIILLSISIFLTPYNRGCFSDYLKYCQNYHDRFAVLIAYGDMGYIPMFLVSSLLGILLVSACSVAIANMENSWIQKKISALGQKTLDLLILNGLFLGHVEPRLSQAFKISASLGSTLLWAVGLTMVQISLLPVTSIFTSRLIKLCNAAASFVVYRLSIGFRVSLRELNSLF